MAKRTQTQPGSQNRELERRVQKLQAGLKRRRIDAMVVFGRNNTFYLTGLRASFSYLLLTPREARLMVDGRYIEAARDAVGHVEVGLMKKPRADLEAALRAIAPRKLGFEGDTPWATVEHWRAMAEHPEMVECGDLIGHMRLVKSTAEARLIEESARLNDEVYRMVLEVATPGMTELDLRGALRSDADAVGAEDLSFDAIVACGAMSARPHYTPGPFELRAGELLLIDMGLKVGGYCSDMTRTVALGRKPKPRLVKAYEATLAAQQAALDAVGPGVECSELDRIARDTLKGRRFGRYFTHGLGHGVGLDIHEAPTLTPLSRDVLRPGMVITIEPGVYLPGLGGVRIEDLVLVTRTGHKVLSHTPKAFEVLPFEA